MYKYLCPLLLSYVEALHWLWVTATLWQDTVRWLVLSRIWHLCTSPESVVPIRLFMGVHRTFPSIFSFLLCLVLLQRCALTAMRLLPCCRAPDIATHSALNPPQTAHLGVVGSTIIRQQIHNWNQSVLLWQHFLIRRVSVAAIPPPSWYCRYHTDKRFRFTFWLQHDVPVNMSHPMRGTLPESMCSIKRQRNRIIKSDIALKWPQVNTA